MPVVRVEERESVARPHAPWGRRRRLPPEEEIRERGHGYALAGNPALERSHPEGGNRTLRIAPRRRRVEAHALLEI